MTPCVTVQSHAGVLCSEHATAAEDRKSAAVARVHEHWHAAWKEAIAAAAAQSSAVAAAQASTTSPPKQHTKFTAKEKKRNRALARFMINRKDSVSVWVTHVLVIIDQDVLSPSS